VIAARRTPAHATEVRKIGAAYDWQIRPGLAQEGKRYGVTEGHRDETLLYLRIWRRRLFDWSVISP
jgi:hypothetical protein